MQWSPSLPVFIQISHLNALSTHRNPVTGSQPEPSGPLSLKSNQNCSHLQRNGLLLTLKVCGLRAEEVHLCWIHVSLISAPFKANSREGGMDFKAMWCTVHPITQCYYSILYAIFAIWVSQECFWMFNELIYNNLVVIAPAAKPWKLDII